MPILIARSEKIALPCLKATVDLLSRNFFDPPNDYSPTPIPCGFKDLIETGKIFKRVSEGTYSLFLEFVSNEKDFNPELAAVCNPQLTSRFDDDILRIQKLDEERIKRGIPPFMPAMAEYEKQFFDPTYSTKSGEFETKEDRERQWAIAAKRVAEDNQKYFHNTKEYCCLPEHISFLWYFRYITNLMKSSDFHRDTELRKFREDSRIAEAMTDAEDGSVISQSELSLVSEGSTLYNNEKCLKAIRQLVYKLHLEGIKGDPDSSSGVNRAINYFSFIQCRERYKKLRASTSNVSGNINDRYITARLSEKNSYRMTSVKECTSNNLTTTASFKLAVSIVEGKNPRFAHITQMCADLVSNCKRAGIDICDEDITRFDCDVLQEFYAFYIPDNDDFHGVAFDALKDITLIDEVVTNKTLRPFSEIEDAIIESISYYNSKYAMRDDIRVQLEDWTDDVSEDILDFFQARYKYIEYNQNAGRLALDMLTERYDNLQFINGILCLQNGTPYLPKSTIYNPDAKPHEIFSCFVQSNGYILPLYHNSDTVGYLPKYLSKVPSSRDFKSDCGSSLMWMGVDLS